MCLSLHINSSHGGLGYDNNAAGGVYPAIIHFFEYYDTLSEDSKNSIPDGVKNELHLIYTLSTDKTQNIDDTENLETCVANRRLALKSAMSAHQERLAEIGSQDTEGLKLIQKEGRLLEADKALLLANIANDRYDNGSDNLGFTRALLESLEVPIQIDSFPLLHHFMASSAEEIHAFLTDEQVKQQVQNLLKSIDELVAFLLNTQTHKIKYIIQVSLQHINTPQKLSALLMPFDEIASQAIIEGMDAHLSRLITKTSDIVALRELNLDQFSLVLEAIKNKLPEIIKDDSTMYALRGLNPNQFSLILKAIKGHLRELIKNSGLMNVLGSQTQGQDHRRLILEAVKDRLPELIEGSDGLSNVFQSLSQEQRTFVLEVIKDRLPAMISMSCELSMILNVLDVEQCQFVLEAIKNQLPEIIKHPSGISTLSELNSEQFSLVYEAIKSYLPDIIKTHRNIIGKLKEFNSDQFSLVLEAIKNKLPEIIKTRSDIDDIRNQLIQTHPNAQHYGKLVHAIRDILPDRIKTFSDLHNIHFYLPQEDKSFVLEAIKDQLPEMIKTTSDVYRALWGLAPEPCTLVINAIKARLSEIMKKPSDVNAVLRPLTPEQRTVVLAATKDHLSTLIKKRSDVNAVLRDLRVDTTDRIHDILHTHIPGRRHAFFSTSNNNSNPDITSTASANRHPVG